jgi:hypothetical protein
LGSRGGIALPMIVTRLQSTNQKFSGMRGVMSAPVGCRNLADRVLAGLLISASHQARDKGRRCDVQWHGRPRRR